MVYFTQEILLDWNLECTQVSQGHSRIWYSLYQGIIGWDLQILCLHIQILNLQGVVTQLDKFLKV